jgi:hypothetical protein
MHHRAYRARFTTYRYGGLILVCCDRCRRLVSICLDPADVPWEAAVHAACGQG